MVKKGLVTMALFCSMSTITLASSDSKKSDETIRDGKTVYSESCAVCHSKAFIPEVLKLGNKEDWKELIEEGQQFPTAHGWVGTRKMPRHGGDPKITLDEFINAVAYMGNQAGANWQESDKLDKAMYKEILKEIQIRLQRNELYDKIGKKY